MTRRRRMKRRIARLRALNRLARTLVTPERFGGDWQWPSAQ